MANKGEVYKLWTIQSADIWNIWLNQGFIGNTSTNIADSHFADAYEWMAQQMLLRIGEPVDGVMLPIWAWHQYDGIRNLKPDIESDGWFAHGTEAVCIEICLPNSAILLSDYMLWHNVLNDGYLGANESDALVFEMRYERTTDVRRRIKQASEIVNSWQRVFDLHTVDEYYQPQAYSDRSIQATFWSAPIDSVERIEHFIAR